MWSGFVMRSPASAEHRANFDDTLVWQLVDRQQFDGLSRRPCYQPTVTATSSQVAVAGKISDGPRVVHWNLSRRSLGLFGHADDLPLSGGTAGRRANKGVALSALSIGVRPEGPAREHTPSEASPASLPAITSVATKVHTAR